MVALVSVWLLVMVATLFNASALTNASSFSTTTTTDTSIEMGRGKKARPIRFRGGKVRRMAASGTELDGGDGGLSLVSGVKAMAAPSLPSLDSAQMQAMHGLLPLLSPAPLAHSANASGGADGSPTPLQVVPSTASGPGLHADTPSPSPLRPIRKRKKAPNFGVHNPVGPLPWKTVKGYSAVAAVAPLHVHWMAAVLRCGRLCSSRNSVTGPWGCSDD